MDHEWFQFLCLALGLKLEGRAPRDWYENKYFPEAEIEPTYMGGGELVDDMPGKTQGIFPGCLSRHTCYYIAHHNSSTKEKETKPQYQNRNPNRRFTLYK